MKNAGTFLTELQSGALNGRMIEIYGCDPDKAQLDLATQCKSVFNTPIYPTIKVEKIGGKAVLRVIVDEQPFGRKPVYFKKEGLPKGAYRRIGSADLVSTEEDLWRFYEDPDSKYDETPVKYSSISDVDERAVRRYRQMRKKVDPEAVELEYETPELLSALGCTSKENPQELNMAGILLFGNELAIKRACARARVDYIRILGNDWHVVADQFDAVDTYAPIFLMVDKLMSIIYGELTTRHRFHSDSIQPETERFPVEVMREAIVNMLMHRDYRHGQYTQIIRYDNRIEICNSGCSLKPDDMLGMKGSVTRNDTIARVCHDTKLAETKDGVRPHGGDIHYSSVALPLLFGGNTRLAQTVCRVWAERQPADGTCLSAGSRCHRCGRLSTAYWL